MKILSNGYLQNNNLQIQNTKFVQNPISFSAKFQKGDTFELSEIVKQNGLSEDTLSHLNYIKTKKDEYTLKYQEAKEIAEKRESDKKALISFLSSIVGSIALTNEEVSALTNHLIDDKNLKFSIKKSVLRKEVYNENIKPVSPKEIADKIVQQTIDKNGEELNEETRKSASSFIERQILITFFRKDVFNIPLSDINSFINTSFSSDLRKLEDSRIYHDYPSIREIEDAIASKPSTFVTLPDNMSLGTKRIINSLCLDQVNIRSYVSHTINNSKVDNVLAEFPQTSEHCTLKEVIDKYGISDVKSYFPDCKVETIEIEGEETPELEQVSRTIVSFPNGSISAKIKSDLDKKLVIPFEQYPKKDLPVALKKYSADSTEDKVNFLYVDLHDAKFKEFQKVGSKMQKLMATLPFKETQNEHVSFIDINDDYNKKLLENALTNPIYPKMSTYYLSHNKQPNVVKIPVSYLEKLGFGSVEQLTEMIKKQQLDGVVDTENEPVVEIIVEEHSKPDKNIINLLNSRKGNKGIHTLGDVAKGLGVTKARLETAIFCGDFEIIDEYIMPMDKEIRYVNILTPKNQDFIRKIKFEQALEQSIKEAQKAERKKIKLEKQDLSQRKQGVRMALVWEFMPNTRDVASELAKKDGYVAKLLAKEDDPSQTLTTKEEAKLNSYRKEVWLLAGIDELKQAHKKASAIMKKFKEEGLSAIDESYLPIFEKYGFVVA